MEGDRSRFPRFWVGISQSSKLPTVIKLPKIRAVPPTQARANQIAMFMLGVHAGFIPSTTYR